MGKTLINIPIHKYIPDEYTESLLLEVYRSGNLVQGPMVERFEEACKKMSGAKYAAAVSNGTVALEMMFRAEEKTKPLVVITNPLSFVATRNAVKHVGGKVVFTGVDYETGMLSEYHVNRHIQQYWHDNVVYVCPVDLHGMRDDIDPAVYGWGSGIYRDSSQAHGVKLQSKDQAMSFSFHASKNATTAEGGVVVSDDENLINEIKLLRNHGMDSKRQIVREDGYNARMTDLQAAVGIGSLNILSEVNDARNDIAEFYIERLIEENEYKSLNLLGQTWYNLRYVYHHFVLRHAQAEKIITVLRYKGIDTRRYYDKLISPPDDCNIPAQKICEESFCIPIHEHLTEDEYEFVIESTIEAIRFVEND